jgi:4-alpha-glucanotransferase
VAHGPVNPEAWGVQGTYELGDHEATAPQESVTAVLEAMGAAETRPPPAPVVVVRSGRARTLPGIVEVVTEEGEVVPAPGGRVPATLPSGYHRAVHRDGHSALLIVSPRRCFLPAAMKTWGWTVQLYALRSRSSWGMGDLADLRSLMRWGDALGTGMTMINPLHAVSPLLPQQPSPYFPSSRCWRNPLYLHIEDVPGYDGALAEASAAGRALNEARRVDRDAIFRLKLGALEHLWTRFPRDDDFDRFRARHAGLLESFATHCALSEVFGPDWRRWPGAYRRPDGVAVGRFREERTERVRFFAWLQWLLEVQLGAAAAGGGLVQDLAVGSDPGGADAWLWQDVIATGVRVGAPPDQFNAGGQDWGVAAFDPWRLRAAGYQPFVQMLRMSLARGGGVRIDHVMGLWRLFWIPAAMPAIDGVYVRYPVDDLLDIVALESERAGAYVIGEDLGTVERGVRRKLSARRILSYRVLWFEEGHPARLPKRSLATVTNHDLPTVAGLWSGADIAAQQAAGLTPDEDELADVKQRVARRAGIGVDASPEEAVDALYRLLARAPSALVGAMLEDALGVPERHNHPGTTDEWPNWSLALPLPLEAIAGDRRVLRLARTLSR